MNVFVCVFSDALEEEEVERERQIKYGYIWICMKKWMKNDNYLIII